MTIMLKFYGQLRDITQKEKEQIQVDKGSTIEDLVGVITTRFPNLEPHLKTVSFAVDNEYARTETVLREGNEVALLPPISGGADD